MKKGCHNCKHFKDSSWVWEFGDRVPNCFMEGYDEESDTWYCERYERIWWKFWLKNKIIK